MQAASGSRRGTRSRESKSKAKAKAKVEAQAEQKMKEEKLQFDDDDDDEFKNPIRLRLPEIPAAYLHGFTRVLESNVCSEKVFDMAMEMVKQVAEVPANR